MKHIFFCGLAWLLMAAELVAQPIIIGGNDPLRAGGSSIRNLRVTEQSPDGTEVVLTMDYSYDGSMGGAAFIVPVIQKKGDKGVAMWFGADPQTVARGRGIVSVKVRYFNDEPGVPAQLKTDSVKVLLMNSTRRSVVTAVPFFKDIEWGSANAQKLKVSEPAGETKTKAQIAAEEEAKKIEASRMKAESEARARQELERRAQEEAKKRQEAQMKAEAEAKRLAEEKVKAEAEAKRLAEERRMAEAKEKAAAELRKQEQMKAEAEAKQFAEEQKAAEIKAKAEAMKREQERLKAEAEAKARAEAEAKLKAEALAREANLKKLAEEKRKAEEMAKAEQEAAKRKQLEEEAKARAAAEEAAKLRAAEEAKKAAEIRAASEAAVKEAERLKAVEQARAKEAMRVQAEVEAKQRELAAKIAAVKAQIEAAAQEEAKAKAKAEAALKKAQELGMASENESKKAKLAEQQKMEAQAKAKAEREKAEAALKQAEEEAAALAKVKEQIKKQAEEAAKLASSANAVIEIPPDIKSQVSNLDVVNRSLDRSEMTIGVEFDYNDKFGSKPLLGVAVAKTGMAEASEYFSAEPMEIKRSRKETVLVPVKFQPPTGKGNFNNYATDRMLVYMADGATAKQVNLFAATMFLVWRPPTAGPATANTTAAKKVEGSVDIDLVRQADVYTGYVTVKYTASGNAKLRVKLYPKGNPAAAEWFKADVNSIKQGSGVELFKVAVHPEAKTEYDLINIDVIEVEMLGDNGQVVASKQLAQTMSWVKPK